jgi:small subunit ribosomal protein S20
LANTKSALKRMRSNMRKRLRNRMILSRTRTALRRAREALAAGQPDEVLIREAISQLDRAVAKGVIHRNNAARRKSRLMKRLNALLAAQVG